MKHRWSEPWRPDHTMSHRTCLRCGLVKTTRHEHENDPPHWIEWYRDGARIRDDKTPACINLENDMPAKKTAAAAEQHPYRLVSIETQNFKKLKAVRVDVEGSIVTISGRNEQGKSSLLDSVMAAIGGKDYFPPEPIRKGQKESKTTLDFGGLKLTRRIWRKGEDAIAHEVRIAYADGSSPKHPQAALDELRGSPIADDPLAFARMKPKERAELVKKLVPGFDFAANAKARKDAATLRTDIGRDHDRAKGALDSMPLPDAKTPKEIVDASLLSAKMADVLRANAEIDAETRRREHVAESVEEMRDRADKLELEVKDLRRKAGEADAALRKLPPIEERQDPEEIAAQVAGAEAINAKVRARHAREEKEREVEHLSARYDGQTAEIEDLDAAKAAAIAKAKLPVEGLQIDEEDVMLDGLPFEQASTARKIRVATALLMALKPDLRVLLVREGSLLDRDARAALAEDAERNGFVVLMETVAESDGDVVIEDGETV